ncbi:MAG: hypothetical protein Q4D22_03820 [Candidatus Saccharibacteria bacterium]|nr:hypothetical protein [Candidatus Saccharibacteria bacterium]
MNKDVIYIEPEDDITDILANIKDAKNKIVALVPPKKAGVLQSAVNFKLIAKTANNHEKTVVLITSDESLLALADKVKMPTAKSLQSKPKLPHSDDSKEFGDDDVDEEISEDEAESEEESEPEPEEKPKKTSAKTKKAAEIAAAETAKDVDIELDAKDVEPEDDDKKNKKDKKAEKKEKNTKVPNFKKYRKYIILFLILFVAIFGFGYWATQIAPRAKITVKVKTVGSNFSETVRFVTDETKSDPENGVFFAEEKTTSKKVSSDFGATGEVDKGAKASGTITVKVKSPVTFSVSDNYSKTFTIPANTIFTYSNGNKYASTSAVNLAVTKAKIGSLSKNCTLNDDGITINCNLSSDVVAEVSVVSTENGEKYNIAASTSGWSFPINTITATKASAMTGGSSKIVKVVSQEDVEKASNDLSGEADKEAREELASQFSSEYILIGNSFAVTSTNTTTSPSLNEEVGEGVTPKIVRETKYVIYAVKKSEVDTYIHTVAEAKIKGDDTQMVYSTGVAINEGDDDKAFFESYKNDNGNMTAKLKSTTKTGPRITEDMVKEVSLGVKIGKVQSNLRSYKGVSEAYVETSYFWVTRVPDDDNKVEIEITVE